MSRKLISSLALFLSIFCTSLFAQIIITPPTASNGAASIVGGTCTNQAVTALSTDGTPTCTTITSAYVNSSIAPSDSPTITTLLNLESDGVRFTASNGVLTILGLGDGADEDLVVDFNTNSNAIAISNSTGANHLDIDFGTETYLQLGDGAGTSGYIDVNEGSDSVDLLIQNVVGSSYGEIFASSSGISFYLGAAIGDFLIFANDTNQYIQGKESTTPSAPSSDRYRLFSKDNGAGKTQLCAIFSSGAAQCFATQP
jgi:hypothetical protein